MAAAVVEVSSQGRGRGIEGMSDCTIPFPLLKRLHTYACMAFLAGMPRNTTPTI